MSGQYDLLGDLGRTEGGVRAILARDIDTGALKVLKVTVDTDDGLDVLIVDAISRDLPATEIKCPSCEQRLRVWGRYCTRCGKDLAGPSAQEAGSSREALLAEIQQLAGEDYEVFGSLPRLEGGGDVYFAQDRASGEIVTISLGFSTSVSDPSIHFEARVTSMLRPLPSGTPIPRSGLRESRGTPLPIEHSDDARRGPRPPRPPAAPSTSPFRAAQAALNGEFELAAIIREGEVSTYYLARDLASRQWVVLSLLQEGGVRGRVSVHRRLSAAETSLDAGIVERFDVGFEGRHRVLARLGGTPDDPEILLTVHEGDDVLVAFRVESVEGDRVQVHQVGVTDRLLEPRSPPPQAQPREPATPTPPIPVGREAEVRLAPGASSREPSPSAPRRGDEDEGSTGRGLIPIIVVLVLVILSLVLALA